MITNDLYMDTYLLEHPVLRPGKVCICSFPGSKATRYSGIDSQNAFKQDVAVMYLLGMAEMIGLVESKEYELMGLIGPPAEILTVDIESVQGRIKYTNMPIRDFCIPDDVFISAWHDKLQGFRSVLLAGKMLGIHCMGGRGRSGTVAAMLLIDLGLNAEKAIIAVRAARPGAIETGEQEQFVRAYRHLNDDRI